MSAEFHPSDRARRAEGQPISQLMARALENPDLISLAAGFVDNDTLPAEPVRRALAELLSDPSAAKAALQYGTTSGDPQLREILLEKARQADGLEHSPPVEQIVVTAGSNQLLHLISESLLDPGDIVLCASPSYFVYLGLLAGLGVRAVGVASDEAGMIPEALVETLERLDASDELDRVKAIYLVPYFDNPGGITMPLERRASVVEVAKRWSRHEKIHVISDEAYRQLRYWGDDIQSTRVCDEEGDTVIVAGTFSKSFSPGIRVGWGILPPHLVGPVSDQKGNVDFGSPNFNQHLMAKVMEMGLFEPHVERIREEYRKKLTAMLEAAREHFASMKGVCWREPTGGLYVWVRVPKSIETGMRGNLFDIAVREGILYVPGEYCYPMEGEAVCRNTMRLSFGVQSCEKIREGVKKLSRAITAVAE
jgi:2-aminoadipate transaminase